MKDIRLIQSESCYGAVKGVGFQFTTVDGKKNYALEFGADETQEEIAAALVTLANAIRARQPGVFSTKRAMQLQSELEAGNQEMPVDSPARS